MYCFWMNQREALTSKLAPQVRRKADPAKNLVKEWVANWRDVRAVSGDASFKQIRGASQPWSKFGATPANAYHCPLASHTLCHVIYAPHNVWLARGQ